MSIRDVSNAARGVRSDYRLEAAHEGRGGQADVFRGIHKDTGTPIALKKLRRERDPEAVARMRREIEVSTTIDHPNVMPVLDADPAATWFVMPLAIDNLEARREDVIQRDQLRLVVDSVCDGLIAAHELGWIHRDVKPSNVLLLSEPERWVIADWGLVRRPSGMTSTGSRTRLGVSYGTEGFAPPEMSVNAHAATAAADVYSVGQLIGWCLTGTLPLQNVPLLPDGGPWRPVVRRATHHDALRRPQSIGDLKQLVEAALYRPPDPPEVHGQTLVDWIKEGVDERAHIDQLLDLVDANPTNEELCVDVLPQLTVNQLRDGVARNLAHGRTIVETLRVERVEWGDRQFRWADQVIYALLAVAMAAELENDLDLLEEAADALFDWDGSWNQWPPQNMIRSWLAGLRNDAAGVVADALADEPDAARHFEGIVDDRNADRLVRDAIRRAIE